MKQRKTRTAALTVPALTIAAAGLAIGATGGSSRSALGPASAAAARTVALTFDDLPWVPDSVPVDSIEARTRRILAALRAHDAPATAFVVGERVLDRPGVDRRLDLLRAWRDAGVSLGNHGWEHVHFRGTPLAAYEDNAVKGNAIPSLLMREAGGRSRYYRPPYNQTGPDVETRDAFESFLEARGWRLAPFTVEDADYIFDDLTRAAADDGARRDSLDRAYRAYFDTAMAFAERLSRETFGREIPQVLLLHADDLNARHLGWILDRLEARGYRFVTLEEATRDSAYASPDGYAGPWGISWLHRWRKGLGLPDRLRVSPDPPNWILDAYRELHGG